MWPYIWLVVRRSTNQPRIKHFMHRHNAGCWSRNSMPRWIAPRGPGINNTLFYRIQGERGPNGYAFKHLLSAAVWGRDAQAGRKHLLLACEFITCRPRQCRPGWRHCKGWTRGRLIWWWRCEEKQRPIYLCLENQTPSQKGEWAGWHGYLSQNVHYTQGQPALCLQAPGQHQAPAGWFTHQAQRVCRVILRGHQTFDTHKKLFFT